MSMHPAAVFFLYKARLITLLSRFHSETMFPFSHSRTSPCLYPKTTFVPLSENSKHSIQSPILSELNTLSILTILSLPADITKSKYNTIEFMPCVWPTIMSKHLFEKRSHFLIVQSLSAPQEKIKTEWIFTQFTQSEWPM